MYKINHRVARARWREAELFGTYGYFDNFRRTVRMLLRSGSLPNVKMMKAADLRNFDHLAKSGRLDRSAERRIFCKRQMCRATFVGSKVALQSSTQ